MVVAGVEPRRRGRPSQGLTSEAQKRASKNWRLRNPEKWKASCQASNRAWHLKNQKKKALLLSGSNLVREKEASD